jgi:hypothetical protein
MQHVSLQTLVVPTLRIHHATIDKSYGHVSYPDMNNKSYLIH